MQTCDVHSYRCRCQWLTFVFDSLAHCTNPLCPEFDVMYYVPQVEVSPVQDSHEA